MGFESVNAAWAIDIFLLLLIGIGPKIALVPFLDATAGLTAAVKGRIVRKMLTTGTRMLLTEKVFGFLLAALAVQLALDGLSNIGVIHLTHP